MNLADRMNKGDAAIIIEHSDLILDMKLRKIVDELTKHIGVTAKAAPESTYVVIKLLPPDQPR